MADAAAAGLVPVDLTAAALVVVDLAAVDLADVVDFTAAGLAGVDVAPLDLVDFFTLVALGSDCAIMDGIGATTAKAANRATGMEIASARKDPV